MPIHTIPELHDHLVAAMRVELSTIPPYLYALYSIEDQQSDAARLIRSIVAEEMLHLALAANLLLAVGGDPDFLDPGLRPDHPGTLPRVHPPVALNLAPATPQQIADTFLLIERPDPVGRLVDREDFDSLGEFYATIEEGILRLSAERNLFENPQVARQLSDERFYAPIAFNVEASGDLMRIDGVASARAAIDVIVHQGEGLDDTHWADPGQQELTHFAKLSQIADGTVPIGALRPLRTNPRTSEYPPAVRPLSDLFNASYAALFVILEDLYSPREKKGGLVNRMYTVMTHVLAPLARQLTQLPLGDGTVAAPTFEPYDLGPEPGAALAVLAAAVAADHPELVAEALTPLLDRKVIG
jgi:hypothetical protein